MIMRQNKNVALDTHNPIVFSCIFILLSRESDQSAIMSSLGIVTGHLCTTHALALPGLCNGGSFENDITFDHTLYTGADPESLGGIDAILNQFEC